MRTLLLGVVLVAATAGSASGLEVRAPGDAPTLVLQAPDSAKIEQHGAQVVVAFAPGTLPVVTVGMVGADPAKDDLTQPAFFDLLSDEIFRGVSQGLGGTVTHLAPVAHVFIAGKPGYLYKANVENQSGGAFVVDLTLLKVSPARVGVMELISVEGHEAADGLQDAIRQATVATQ